MCTPTSFLWVDVSQLMRSQSHATRRTGHGYSSSVTESSVAFLRSESGGICTIFVQFTRNRRHFGYSMFMDPLHIIIIKRRFLKTITVIDILILSISLLIAHDMDLELN